MPAVKEVSIVRVTVAAAAAPGAAVAPAAGSPGSPAAPAAPAALDRRARRDLVVVEAPLAVSARGRRVLTLMRTPGDDLELVAGLLHAEALPAAAVTVLGADAVDVDLDPALFAPRALDSVAACGVCGRQTIAELERVSRAVAGDFTIDAEVVRHLPEALRRAQQLFDDTGGLHAAALATARGELLAVREDVGRHNAVDKVVGWARAAAVPAERHVLVVSGRLGYEIAQKAIRFGVPVVVAVSAPSSLAIELAERFSVALCGFVRGDRFNIYSHAWRVG